jgi:hypothetical protein
VYTFVDGVVGGGALVAAARRHEAEQGGDEENGGSLRHSRQMVDAFFFFLLSERRGDDQGEALWHRDDVLMKRKRIYRRAGTCTGVESRAHCMEIQKLCLLRRLGRVEKFWSNAEKMKEL